MRLAFLLTLLLIANFAIADGGMWVRQDNWLLHPESQQYAIIDHNDGYERLGLTVEFTANNKATNAVWVVPIPANPNKVDIKLIDGFPVPSGKNINDQAKDVLAGASFLAAAWGTFPLSLPLAFGLVVLRGSISSAGMKTLGMDNSAYYDGISIFQRVSLGGVTSDLVSTNDPQELESFLSSKGVNLAGEYKMILEKFVDQDYSFVVTYISDWQKFQSSKTGSYAQGQYGYGNYESNRYYPNRDSTPISLRVGFPSEKAYFPLRLSSIYGDQVIPITIYLMGNYKPKLFNGIGGGVKSEYFRDGYVSQNYNYRATSDGKTEEFFRPGRILSNLDYTKITINEKSINFKDDLWFDYGTPLTYGFKTFIADNFLAVLILIMIISSAAASVVSGRLIFKDGLIDDTRFALQGLWNIGTMIGFVLVTVFWTTQKLDDKTKKQLSEKGLSVFDSRKIAYIVLFYVLFIVALVVQWFTLTLIATN